MKSIFKKLFVLLPFLCACSIIPKDEKFRSQLIHDFSKDMQKNKNLTLIATGGGQQGRLFVLRYRTQQNLNLKQARELLVDICEGFLKRVNDDQQLRPYLVEYPYNCTNIDISIFFVDSKNSWCMPPYMAVAANDQSELHYYTTNKEEKLLHWHKETYEEALKIVKENQN